MSSAPVTSSATLTEKNTGQKPSYFSNVWKQISATKSVDSLIEEAANETNLQKTLGAFDLTMMGIGAIIGTGIFVLTGTAAARNAGPAVMISFIVAGFAAATAGLCYAELASMIPISGSAFTFTYATMGEFVAWIIGWDLILEYLVGAATVAVGWSAYLQSFLFTAFGVTLPKAIAKAPLEWKDHHVHYTDGYFDLPAVLITLAVSGILIFGVRESSKVNDVVVLIKVVVVILFIVVTASRVTPSNWTPFIPDNTGEFGHYGVSGIFQGATTVFFAYIGFDAVTTTAQECKNPQRDLPIGVLGSLVVCTILYIGVSIVLTGLVPYKELNVANPISFAVEKIGLNWLATLISIGAIAGLTSVLLMSLLGQPRIFYAMAKDGLFPKVATRIHPKYKTPHVTTAITGFFCAVCAGILPIDILGELTSIGTLFAFFLVSLGVMILRLRRPDIERKFRVPGGTYLIPILGMLSSGLLVCTATTATILRLFIWMFLGAIIYFGYGFRHSKLRRLREEKEAAEKE